MEKQSFTFTDLAEYNRKQDEWRHIPTRVTVNLDISDGEAKEILAIILACSRIKATCNYVRPMPEQVTCNDPWQEALELVSTDIGVMPASAMDYPGDVITE